MTLSPNNPNNPNMSRLTADQRHPAPVETPDARPGHDVVTVAGVDLTISHYGMLTYRDFRGVPIHVEMTNDIQNLIDTLAQGSGDAPVVNMTPSAAPAPNSNLRTVGQGEVQRPYLTSVVGGNE